MQCTIGRMWLKTAWWQTSTLPDFQANAVCYRDWPLCAQAFHPRQVVRKAPTSQCRVRSAAVRPRSARHLVQRLLPATIFPMLVKLLRGAMHIRSFGMLCPVHHMANLSALSCPECPALVRRFALRSRQLALDAATKTLRTDSSSAVLPSTNLQAVFRAPVFGPDMRNMYCRPNSCSVRNTMTMSAQPHLGAQAPKFAQQWFGTHMETSALQCSETHTKRLVLRCRGVQARQSAQRCSDTRTKAQTRWQLREEYDLRRR